MFHVGLELFGTRDLMDVPGHSSFNNLSIADAPANGEAVGILVVIILIQRTCFSRSSQVQLPINIQRNKLFFQRYNKKFTEQYYYNRTLALRGMRLIFITERVHSGAGNYKTRCPFLILSKATQCRMDICITSRIRSPKDRQRYVFFTSPCFIEMVVKRNMLEILI